MPIDIYLRNESGKPISYVLDPNGHLMNLWPFQEPSFPLLQYLDPYGDAIFNRYQMNELLLELDLLRKRADQEAVLLLFDQIKGLVQRCADDYHIYLAFVGD